MPDRSGAPSGPGFDPEEALWTELIRGEMDSWNPRRLPPRFRPRDRRPGLGLWGPLPLVVAFSVLVLMVAGLASLPHGVGGMLTTLSGVRPAGLAGGRGPGPSASAQYPAATSGAGVFGSSARTSQAGLATATPTAGSGTASQPRTNSPSPTPEIPPPTPFIPEPPPSPLPTMPEVPPLATPGIAGQPLAVLSADQQLLSAPGPSPEG